MLDFDAANVPLHRMQEGPPGTTTTTTPLLPADSRPRGPTPVSHRDATEQPGRIVKAEQIHLGSNSRFVVKVLRL